MLTETQPTTMVIRRDLPSPPDRIARLPVDARGYPVPFFVTWLDQRGMAVQRGTVTPDFRVVTGWAVRSAYEKQICWVCGERVGSYKSFVIGPMCAINRTSGEPASHLECADYAARACPFLVKPHMRRRTAHLPEGYGEAAGIMLTRNPGVALVWTTKRYEMFSAPGGTGMLFKLGDPESVRWYAEGRAATREEVLDSIDAGLPDLQREASEEGALAQLERRCLDAMRWLPPVALDLKVAL